MGHTWSPANESGRGCEENPGQWALYPGRLLFKEKLDGTLVLLAVIGAGGIDEHATRLEEVEGPKEQQPLEPHQSRPGPNGRGESPVDVRTSLSIL